MSSIRTLKQAIGFLRENTDAMAKLLRKDGAISASDLKDHKPGGALNPELGFEGWLDLYRWLQRTHAGHGADAPASHKTTDERLILEALRGKPERVVLVQEIETRRTVAVHPKAAGPLVWCHLQNLKLGLLGGHIRALQGSSDPADREVVAQAWQRILRLQRQLVWAVTTEGCGLPFDRDAEPDPTPPAWTDHLDVMDVHRIVEAFQRVHSVRLLALDHLYPSTEGAPDRPALWATFATGASEALGISTADLWEEMNFPGVVARLRVGSADKRAAMDEAKAKAKAAHS